VKISDLQKLLRATKRKHGDLEILEVRFSDYQLMDPKDWKIAQASSRVDGRGEGWLMRDHYSLTEKQRQDMSFKPYLLFSGN
jgi:hypothetical protein